MKARRQQQGGEPSGLRPTALAMLGPLATRRIYAHRLNPDDRVRSRGSASDLSASYGITGTKPWAGRRDCGGLIAQAAQEHRGAQTLKLKHRRFSRRPLVTFGAGAFALALAQGYGSAVPGICRTAERGGRTHGAFEKKNIPTAGSEPG